MARLWTYGFEIGVIDPNEYADSGFGVVTTGVAVARTGSYGYSAVGVQTYVRRTLAADKTELFIRHPWYVQAPRPADDRCLLHLRNSDGDPMVDIMTVANTDQIKVCKWEGSAWTVLATSAQALALDTYQCIEAHIHLDNAGDFDIRVDGVDWITFPGDTLGDQTPASIRTVGFGADGAGQWCRMLSFDDLAINDTTGGLNNSWCGRGGVYPLVPSTAGNITGLIPSAGANWQCVDEVPPNTTDYVYTSTVGSYDLYETADPAPTAGSVMDLRIFGQAKLAAAGSGSGAMVLRTNATEYTSGATALDTTWRWLTQLRHEINPFTGVQWTVAEIQALQIGLRGE